MLEIKTPRTWLQASVKELYDFVQQVDGNISEAHKDAQILQKFGTKQVHNDVLNGFDNDSFLDMKKVLDGRLRMEKPELDVIFGKVPDKKSGAFSRVIQKRIEFASKYKYAKNVIASESERFKPE